MPADSESRRSKPLALSASQVKRFYYTTTTAEAFPWKEISETSRGENFIDVHGIGQRTGKYFKYQKKRAPLLDRSSVYYYTDYVVLPLDDAPVTKALAKENKLRSSPGFASTTAAIFDDSTANKDAFHGFSRKEASRARQKSCKPKAGRTTTLPTGDLLEKRSVTHEAFGLPVRFPVKLRNLQCRISFWVSGVTRHQHHTKLSLRIHTRTGGRQVLVRLNRGPPPAHQGDLPLQGHLDPARLLHPGPWKHHLRRHQSGSAASLLRLVDAQVPAKRTSCAGSRKPGCSCRTRTS